MCGVFCLVTLNNSQVPPRISERIKRHILQLVRRRGPDGCERNVSVLKVRCQLQEERETQHEKSVDVCGVQQHDISVETVASVLHLRGPFTPQPLTDEKGNVLLWNAEIFGGLEVGEHANDTRVLLSRLKECSDDTDLAVSMSHIRGPWAFVYYQVKHQLLWFGRDFFGRRSLVWHLPLYASDSFSLSSVATRTDEQTDWVEVPTGLYSLNLSSVISGQIHITWYSWSYGEGRVNQQEKLLAELSLKYQQCVVFIQSPIVMSPPVAPFNSCLSAMTITPCSGKHVGTPIVCSQSEDGSLHSVVKKQLAETLLNLLENAVSKRVRNIPQLCDIRTRVTKCECEAVHVTSHSNCPAAMLGNAKLGVLFSGGVDSIVLAALADRCLDNDEEIDLLNVAFEQRVASDSGQSATAKKPQECEDKLSRDSSFDVPDRLTGLSGLEELKKLNCARKWNFIQINVTAVELQRNRERHIGDLVYPHTTVLDDSIGCALWFAARGRGILNCAGPIENQVYESRAKVLLVGMGADEQLGGYSRHTQAYQLRGWQGLLDEIQLDVSRISQRNLGRDDRCISDHGRECRLPYLDEDVVSFLNSLPVWCKTEPRLPRGQGEKILLRHVAGLLGLDGSAKCPKRAIQFGSRIAKLQGTRNKGCDTCRYLVHDVAAACSEQEQLQ